MSVRWYALVDHEVIGPFETMDRWYIEHGGPDWRHREWERTGHDPWGVERTDLGDGREVSTVFLGLDHSFNWDNPNQLPIVFETMIFPDADLAGRYAWWDDAVTGHWQVVANATTLS